MRHGLRERDAPILAFGGTAVGWKGDAERAIDWGERAIRISPFDRLLYMPNHAIAVGNFLLGRYDKAAEAARQGDPLEAGVQHPACHLGGCTCCRRALGRGAGRCFTCSGAATWLQYARVLFRDRDAALPRHTIFRGAPRGGLAGLAVGTKNARH